MAVGAISEGQAAVPAGQQELFGVELPIRRRGGVVVGFAVVDAADAYLSRERWSLDQDGYVVASPRRGVKLRLHRVVLGLEPADRREADHVNGDKWDNRRSNLRPATRQQNGQNVPGRGGASRYRNVYYESTRRSSKKWRARGVVGGRNVHVGWYATEREAADAAAAWRAVHMPFAVEERECLR